ncbi:LysM domain-containing protein [Roseovarius sp. MBR-6]|jgi:phage tail protein X|uniref:LysM domain-containing protein n=1 Tax=Roseovarius sp. MBR-6 TaxID=3156459 RepID=UPI003391EF80
MVRMVLIVAAFLAVTIAIVLVQPGTSRRAATADAAPDVVTRGEVTDLSAVSAPDMRLDRAAQTDPLQDATRLLTAPPPEARTKAPPVAPEQVARPAPTSRPAEIGFEAMVLDALAQGQSEQYIDALVNDAAVKGRVEVPTSFLTADGRVDTATILSVLSAPARPRIPETYTVAMGDSIAALSYRFYGTLDRQADILAINPGLERPGALALGTVITLPRP